MPPRLHIAKSGAQYAPTLPADAITRTFGVLGQRDTGKTTTAVVLVEEMVKRKGNVAVLDPVGAWWGITRDGEGKGLKGIVVGGEHGDVPLEETGGQLVAELVVGRHYPVVVIDLKLLRKGAQLRFMADYLEALFHSNRAPLHQVFEEADRALPQEKRSGFDVVAARVLGAGEDIVKLGRSRGLGATLVTQRPATVNKNVLEQVEGLVVHRLFGPNDQKAIKAWIQANGDPAKTQDVMKDLAALKQGEAWLYVPVMGLLDRVRIRQRRTFDSSATPTSDPREQEQQANRAPVNLDTLREQMAETVERAKANDPAELRRRIVDLQKQLDDADREAPAPEKVEVEKEVLIPDAAAVEELASTVEEIRHSTADARGLIGDLERYVEILRPAVEQAGRTAAFVEDSLDAARALPERVERPTAQPQAPGRPATAGRADRPAPSAPRPELNGDTPLGKAPRTLLETLVSVHPRRLTRAELSTLSGYKPRSSTYRNALSALRQAAMLDERGDSYAPTQTGFDLFGGQPVTPKTPEDIRAMWRRTFGDSAPGAMFDRLVGAYPSVVSRETLSRDTGYSITSSTFRNALSALRKNGLMEDISTDQLRAADSLFGAAVPA